MTIFALTARRLALCLTGALAGLTAPLYAEQPQASLPELAQLDTLVAEALSQAKAPGAAISIVKDGKVVLSKGYGSRSLATGLPMDSTTLFPIQSETKAFTALSAVMLRDEGKLDLDAPISTYVPSFRMKDSLATLEVSIRDFLTHRSGLGVYSLLWIANDGTSRAEAVASIAHLPPPASFRTQWLYSNIGYVAAANAVERVAETPWERFVEQRIFMPLGMDRTTFSREQALRDPNRADGSMFWDGRLGAMPMQTTTAMTNSTGGIISTADDMAKWMLFQLNGGSANGQQLVKAESLAETHQPQMVTLRPLPSPEFTSSAYGLGWFVESYRGEQLIEHGGNHWGVNSAVGLFPDRKLGISVFINEDSDLATYLMLAIADRFIGPGSRDWVQLAATSKIEMEADHRAMVEERDKRAKEVSPPARALSNYVGTYTHPGFGRITVRQEKNGLVLQHDDDASGLVSIGPDLFRPTTGELGNVWAMLDAVQVQFVPGYDGRISALRTTATADGVVFTKD